MEPLHTQVCKILLLTDLRLDNRRGWARLCTCLIGYTHSLAALLSCYLPCFKNSFSISISLSDVIGASHTENRKQETC